MEKQSNISNIVKEIKQKQGLDQKGFANRYGVPLATVKAWECGLRTPPQYVVDMLVDKAKSYEVL